MTISSDITHEKMYARKLRYYTMIYSDKHGRGYDYNVFISPKIILKEFVMFSFNPYLFHVYEVEALGFIHQQTFYPVLCLDSIKNLESFEYK